MFKVKAEVDAKSLTHEELIETFCQVGKELGERGEWFGIATINRFVAELLSPELMNWMKAVNTMAKSIGIDIPTNKPVRPNTRLNLTEQILAENGQKITAIKAFRDRVRTENYVPGLVEAKAEVDAWVDYAISVRAEIIAKAIAQAKGQVI